MALVEKAREEVSDVVGVVSEAPRDKVWGEVKGAGKNVCVGELEQSSRPCVRVVQSREPKVVGGVTWYINVWALVYKRAETQVRKRETRARESNQVSRARTAMNSTTGRSGMFDRGVVEMLEGSAGW